MTEDIKNDQEVSPEETNQAESASAEEIKEQPKAEEDASSPENDAKEPATEKGPAMQPKATSSVAPTECAACSKALLKKMWYYRNGQFFCNKKCFKRKETENAKQTEAA